VKNEDCFMKKQYKDSLLLENKETESDDSNEKNGGN
jgi:hypothetical protein